MLFGPRLFGGIAVDTTDTGGYWGLEFGVGSPLVKQFSDVAVDGQYNVCFGGQVADSPAYALVAKFDEAGENLWQKSYADAESESPVRVGVDGADNVYLGFANSAGEVVVVKLNASGVELWQRKATHSAYAAMTDMHVDGDGNVYAAVLTFDESYEVYEAGVVKWNTSGTPQWSRGVRDQGGGFCYPHAVTADSSGNVYLVGYVDPLSGATKALMCKWSASGTSTYRRDYVVTGYDTVFTGVATDGTNVFTCGHYDGGFKVPLLVKWSAAGSQLEAGEYAYNNATDIVTGDVLLGTDGAPVLCGYMHLSGVTYPCAIRVDSSGLAADGGVAAAHESGAAVVADCGARLKDDVLYLSGLLDRTGTTNDDAFGIKAPIGAETNASDWSVYALEPSFLSTNTPTDDTATAAGITAFSYTGFTFAAATQTAGVPAHTYTVDVLDVQ